MMSRVPDWLVNLSASAVVLVLLLQPTSGFKSALVGLGLVVLIAQSIPRKQRITFGGLGWLLLAYLAICLISAAGSIHPAISKKQFIKLVELMAGYVVLVNFITTETRLDRGLRWLTWALGGLAIADNARFLFETFVSGTSTLQDGRWFNSLLGYPTIAAGMYTIGLLLCLAGALSANASKGRLLYIISAVSILALLYLLQTRSVLLGLAAGIMAMLVLSPLTPRRQAMTLVLVTAAVALIVLIPSPFRDRLFSGTSDRTGLWHDASRIISKGVEEKPMRTWTGFGYGHKVFERPHRQMPGYRRHAVRWYDHTHNLFLEARFQTGYLGVLAFSAILIGAAFRFLRHFPGRRHHGLRLKAAALAGAFVALMIYGQFSLFFAFLPALMFWTLLAAMMACAAITRLSADKQY